MEPIQGTWIINKPFDVVDAAIMRALRHLDLCFYFQYTRVTEGYSLYDRFGFGTATIGKPGAGSIAVRKIEAGTELTIEGHPNQ